jgi:hypothetical protein
VSSHLDVLVGCKRRKLGIRKGVEELNGDLILLLIRPLILVAFDLRDT